MMISDVQARLAYECLLTTQSWGDPDVADACSKLPPDLLARVNEVLADVPDTRRERVEQARADLAEGLCSSQDVAGKIIARAISDSLR